MHIGDDGIVLIVIESGNTLLFSQLIKISTNDFVIEILVKLLLLKSFGRFLNLREHRIGFFVNERFFL